MRKPLSAFTFLFPLISMSLFSSCSKDEVSTVDAEVIWNYTDEAMFSLQERGNLGRFGCYELVFPVTIVFPDESTVETGSYEELRDAIFAWKEANPDATERPAFEFPIEVLSDEGEVISVADGTELQDLRRECRRDFFNRHGHRGHRHLCTPCFSLVFPLTIAFPDGTSVEVADRADMKMQIRAWKAANPDVEGRPELSFPINVELEDGTIVSVGSREELQALRESCAN